MFSEIDQFLYLHPMCKQWVMWFEDMLLLLESFRDTVHFTQLTQFIVFSQMDLNILAKRLHFIQVDSILFSLVLKLISFGKGAARIAQVKHAVNCFDGFGCCFTILELACREAVLQKVNCSNALLAAEAN